MFIDTFARVVGPDNIPLARDRGKHVLFFSHAVVFFFYYLDSSSLSSTSNFVFGL